MAAMAEQKHNWQLTARFMIREKRTSENGLLSDREHKLFHALSISQQHFQIDISCFYIFYLLVFAATL